MRRWRAHTTSVRNLRPSKRGAWTAPVVEGDGAMQELRISRRHVLKGASAMGMLGALSIPAVVSADTHGDDRHFRWDILTPDATITPGGHLSAKASDGSTITMTGSGTFEPGEPEDVSGGGTWTTAGGAVGSHSGTYRVKSLITFTQAPGAIPPGAPDLIGRAADARAGLPYSGSRSPTAVKVSCVSVACCQDHLTPYWRGSPPAWASWTSGIA